MDRFLLPGGKYGLNCILCFHILFFFFVKSKDCVHFHFPLESSINVTPSGSGYDLERCIEFRRQKRCIGFKRASRVRAT